MKAVKSLLGSSGGGGIQKNNSIDIENKIGH